MKKDKYKTQKQLLLAKVKSQVFPFLKAHGFEIQSKNGASGFYEFHRLKGYITHLAQIQFDKLGRPRFRVKLGIVSASTLPTEFDEKPTLSNITCSHLPMEFLTYLKEGTATNLRLWFRSDRLIWLKKQPQEDAACSEVESLWEDAEVWFSNMEQQLKQSQNL